MCASIEALVITLIDYGRFFVGNAYRITIVPLYDTLGPQSTKFILQQTGLKTVVCGGDCVGKVLDALQEQQQQDEKDGSAAPNSHVRADTIICLDSVTEGERNRADGLGVKLTAWSDVIKAVRFYRRCISTSIRDS